MKNKTLSYVIIFASIALIAIAFIVAKYLMNEDVPNLIFVILGAAILITPSLFYLVSSNRQKQMSETASDSQTRDKLRPLCIYIIGSVILFTLLFFVCRSYFLPLLICQMPMLVFFVVQTIKNYNKSEGTLQQ